MNGLNLYLRKQVGIDDFPLLLIRSTYTTTCNAILSSFGIPNKIKGYGTEEMIHFFLDASSVNSTNSRVVILSPIYCMLKQILSDFELSCHIGLLNKISLRVFNGDPRSFLLSEIISDRSNEIIRHPVENSLVKDSSQICLYCDSLDLELDKKEILRRTTVDIRTDRSFDTGVIIQGTSTYVRYRSHIEHRLNQLLKPTFVFTYMKEILLQATNTMFCSL